MEVEKVLNTSDLLPTVLNLMGVDSPYSYLGQDAFDPDYVGYAIFPNGSWVTRGVAYNSTNQRTMPLENAIPVTVQLMEEMAGLVADYVRINNLILETDYYAAK